MKLLRVVRLLASVAGVLMCCVPGPSGAAGTPYELNAIVSMTGPGAFFGASAGKTLKIQEELVNAQGGINGRPLKVVVWDDQSSPQVAVQLAGELIAKKVPLILGPSLTATCQAVAPLLARTGPVMYCVSPFIDPAPGSYVYANGETSLDTASAVVRFFRLRGLTRMALITASDASGLALEKAYEAAFALPENKPVNVVARQHFAPGDVTVAAQMAQIKAANPQVLIAWTVGAPFGTIVRGAHESGLDVPVVTNGGNLTLVQIQQLADYLPRELDYSAHVSWVQGAVVPPRVRAQLQLYDKAFRDAGIKPDGGYGSVWDMLLVLVEALRHVPADPTAEQVNAYLQDLRGWAGANGIYDFKEIKQRGIREQASLIARWDAVKNEFVPASKPGGYLR